MITQFKFKEASLIACSLYDLLYTKDLLPKYNISIIYVLIEPQELLKKEYDILKTLHAKHNIIVKRFPIQDYSVPTSFEKFDYFIQSILKDIVKGENVLIHCFGGKGRTGLVLIGLFMRILKSFKKAYKYVTSKRQALDTSEQIDFLFDYEKWLNKG